MRRVLVAVSSEDVSQKLVGYLSETGYQTGTVHNGVEAVIKVEDGAWDIVILGTRLPELNGVDASKIIKKIRPELPVVLLLDTCSDVDVYVLKQSGVQACLFMPVHRYELLGVLREAATGNYRRWSAGPGYRAANRGKGGTERIIG